MGKKECLSIGEDLTPLRGKILRKVKMDQEIKRLGHLMGRYAASLKRVTEQLKKIINLGDKWMSKYRWGSHILLISECRYAQNNTHKPFLFDDFHYVLICSVSEKETNLLKDMELVVLLKNLKSWWAQVM